MPLSDTVAASRAACSDTAPRCVDEAHQSAAAHPEVLDDERLLQAFADALFCDGVGARACQLLVSFRNLTAAIPDGEMDRLEEQNPGRSVSDASAGAVLDSTGYLKHLGVRARARRLMVLAQALRLAR